MGIGSTHSIIHGVVCVRNAIHNFPTFEPFANELCVLKCVLALDFGVSGNVCHFLKKYDAKRNHFQWLRKKTYHFIEWESSEALQKTHSNFSHCKAGASETRMCLILPMKETHNFFIHWWDIEAKKQTEAKPMAAHWKVKSIEKLARLFVFQIINCFVVMSVWMFVWCFFLFVLHSYWHFELGTYYA